MLRNSGKYQTFFPYRRLHSGRLSDRVGGFLAIGFKRLNFAFRYLNPLVPTVEGMDEEKEWKATLYALKILGFTDAEQVRPPNPSLALV